jgi:hypothetical protein
LIPEEEHILRVLRKVLRQKEEMDRTMEKAA